VRVAFTALALLSAEHGEHPFARNWSLGVRVLRV